MIDKWVTRVARVAERLVPDAISTSIILLVVVLIAALASGNSLSATFDAYYRGLWGLLPFTMQMTLIIVLSSVVGATPPFRKAVFAFSRLPKTPTQVIVLAVLLSSGLSYLYWGLGIALGPLIAVHFCREAERKKIDVDFLFTLSVVLAANSVWQYGLSASAPLLMATPGHFLEATTGTMPLRSTIWSPAAITHVLVFVLAMIAAGRFLMPRNITPVSAFPEAHKLGDPVEDDPTASARGLSYSERLERYSPIAIVLCAVLGGWLYYHFGVKKLGLDLNSLNVTFLLLGFLLHRNVFRFTAALRDAIVTSWSVVVIYHLYAGVGGLIQYTTLGDSLARAFALVSTRYTFPLLVAFAGTIVAVFVPSSGGQWIIQGFVTVKAASEVGVTAQRAMLALGIGDQMGNLLSPFWYVVVAGIARVDFRRFFGYGLMFAMLWFLIGVLVFTFVPC
jgi:short-chain fatty acids transporter